MESKRSVQIIINVVVVIIGIYMVINYVNVSTPPVLSGIAFILIGIGRHLDSMK